MTLCSVSATLTMAETEGVAYTKETNEFFSTRISRRTTARLRVPWICKSNSNTNQSYPDHPQRRGCDRLCRNRHWQNGRISPAHHSATKRANAPGYSCAGAGADARTGTPDSKELRRAQSSQD